MLTTLPRARAARLAKAIVKRRLAACGNISQVRSVYPWKGALRDEAEALIIFKTTRQKVPRLMAFLEKEHPYETSVNVEVKCRVNAKYLSWVVESVAA